MNVKMTLIKKPVFQEFKHEIKASDKFVEKQGHKKTKKGVTEKGVKEAEKLVEKIAHTTEKIFFLTKEAKMD